MKILFIGGLFSNKQKDSVLKDSKTMPNMAANVHQWNIVNGLGDNVDIINPLFLGNFPKEYKKIIVRKSKWKHNQKSNNISPSTINIFGIKQLFRLFTLSKEIRKWIYSQESEENIILIYSLNTSFLYSLKLARLFLSKKYKIKTCLIVPDLPLFYINNKGKNRIYRFLKTIDWKLMIRETKNIDSFILLTEQMKNKIPINFKPFFICEGICTIEHLLTYKNISEKSITYTGTLDVEFGVVELLKNFTECASDDWVLNIAGSGNAVNIVKKYAKNDLRIHYYGILSNEDTKVLQCKSRLLINPRSNIEEFTKYSFPSKTMEYLKSGRPILMYHLAGIPKEYDEFLNYFEDTSSKCFQTKLVAMMEKSNLELDTMGERGKRFVEQNKNYIVQGKKIINFLNNI